MIYFDNAASTPITDEIKYVIDNVAEVYGNPSSAHYGGKEAKALISLARERILNYLSAKNGTVIFTSGGTESNNLAIMGVANYLRKIGKTTIITSKIEHPSVLNVCKHMENNGFNVIYMPVCYDGRVDIEELDKIMQKNRDTLGLVTIQTVNSEIGTMQCIEDIGFLCRENEVLFHTDAVQAVGHVRIDVEKYNIDMLSISGHKIYTPKGVGALYVRNKEILSPIMFGGGQEFGVRSGTENTIGIAALGTAVFNIDCSLNIMNSGVSFVRDYMIKKLEEFMTLPYSINCLDYSDNIISLTIPGVEGSSLAMMLSENGIYISTGSACSSSQLEPSHVLKAIGLSDSDAACTVRISLSYLNTLTEANAAAKYIAKMAQDIYSLKE